MRHFTSTCSWQTIIDSLSRAADALLLIIVAWVGRRLAITSKAVQSTLEDLEPASPALSVTVRRSGAQTRAEDQSN